MHPVTGVTGLHVARYARQLDDAGLSPASAARKLAAISSWYAWLARRGHITASPAAGIARPRANPDAPPAPALTRDQALTLVHAADTAPGPQRARTAALVALLLFTGARVSEVIGANVEDLGTEQGHRVLRVTRSKGRRQSLALPGPAASRIDAYLAGRPAPAGVPALFATRTGGRLFAADVWHTVRRLAARAGLPADLTSHLGPRMMRHSFAALYLDAGRSLRDLQNAMGYADPRATQRYDQARHTPVTHLALHRQRAPLQPLEPPPQPQPARRTGPWPQSRPHCRARRPQPAAGHIRPRLSQAGGRHSCPGWQSGSHQALATPALASAGAGVLLHGRGRQPPGRRRYRQIADARHGCRQVDAARGDGLRPSPLGIWSLRLVGGGAIQDAGADVAAGLVEGYHDGHGNPGDRHSAAFPGPICFIIS